MIWRRTRSSVVCLVQRVGISRGGVGPTLLLAAGDQEDRIIVLYYGPVWFIGKFPAGRLLLSAGTDGDPGVIAMIIPSSSRISNCAWMRTLGVVSLTSRSIGIARDPSRTRIV